jgi:hypothetical protein
MTTETVARTGYQVYHVGFLAKDREHNYELNKLANQHWKDAEDGRCLLLQRKLSADSYEYRRIERNGRSN